MAIKAEPAIEKAQKVLEYLGTNAEIRRYYELREKAIHDEITRITGARNEGKAEGSHTEGTINMKSKNLHISCKNNTFEY